MRTPSLSAVSAGETATSKAKMRDVVGVASAHVEMQIEYG
jgi:hypothetical protein